MNVEITSNEEVAKVENFNQCHNRGAIMAQFVTFGDAAIRRIETKRQTDMPNIKTSRAKARRKLYRREIESTKKVVGSPTIMDAKDKTCIGKSQVEYLRMVKKSP